MDVYCSKFSIATMLGLFFLGLLSGCTTYNGYRGAGLGAFTGSTAGALLDSNNPWRGAFIGAGLGATLGGALTDRPYYSTPYGGGYYYNPGRYSVSTYCYTPYYPSRDYALRDATVGGLTGATAGALLDDGNRWRGGMVGGILGSLFGGGIGWVNSRPGVPVLHP